MFRPKLILALLLLLSGFKPEAGEAQILTAGFYHTCLWSGVVGMVPYCWGKDTNEQFKNTPTITDVIQMDAGANHTCALYRNEKGSNAITCWGDDSEDKLKVPPEIIDPIAISVGDWHACAIYRKDSNSTNLSCWPDIGDNNRPPLDRIENPTAVYAGSEMTCIIHKINHLRCWGSVRVEDDLITSDKYPNLTSGKGLMCKITGSDSVDCWTNKAYLGSTYVVDYRHTQECHISDNQLTCVGSSKKANDTPPLLRRETLVAPWQVATGLYHTCVLASFGLQCYWNFKSPDEEILNYDRNLTELGVAFTGVDNIGLFLEQLAQCVYREDAELLRVGVNYTNNMVLNRDDRILLLELYQAYLDNLEYPELKTMFLEKANRGIESFITQLHTAPPQDIVSDHQRRMVKGVLAIALEGMRPFLGKAQERILLSNLKMAFSMNPTVRKEDLVAARDIAEKYSESDSLRGRSMLIHDAIRMLDSSVIDDETDKKPDTPGGKI